ncbi:MAG TPA: NlpC/P60 family protein [Actinomycetota bacterium]|nr:NlpC/P60 family protein [Actinomycetota bacterium]
MPAKSLVAAAVVTPVLFMGGLGAATIASAAGSAGTTLVQGTVPEGLAPYLERYGHTCPELTPGRLAAQLYQESGFRTDVVSSANAQGLAQFLPGTWAAHGRDGDGDGRAVIWNPADAVRSAAEYDCSLAGWGRGLPGDHVNNMLAAYNAGYGRMKLLYQGGTPWPAETQNYVRRIRALERAFTAVRGPVPPSRAAAIAIQYARSKLGTPYLWGGTGTVEQGGRFDCSGLMQAAYRAAGLNLSRTSRTQWYDGPHVPREQLQPGDLVFFAWDTTSPASIHHVGMYVGGGYMINAPYTGAVIRFDKIDTPGYIGAVRPTAA